MDVNNSAERMANNQVGVLVNASMMRENGQPPNEVETQVRGASEQDYSGSGTSGLSESGSGSGSAGEAQSAEDSSFASDEKKSSRSFRVVAHHHSKDGKEKTPPAHSRQSIRYVVKFMKALRATRPSLSEQERLAVHRKKKEILERKRRVNRLSAKRKRARERGLLDSLSEQFRQLSAVNEALKADNEEVQKLLSSARDLMNSRKRMESGDQQGLLQKLQQELVQIEVTRQALLKKNGEASHQSQRLQHQLQSMLGQQPAHSAQQSAPFVAPANPLSTTTHQCFVQPQQHNSNQAVNQLNQQLAALLQQRSQTPIAAPAPPAPPQDASQQVLLALLPLLSQSTAAPQANLNSANPVFQALVTLLGQRLLTLLMQQQQQAPSPDMQQLLQMLSTAMPQQAAPQGTMSSASSLNGQPQNQGPPQKRQRHEQG